jgi:RNA polymerase-interacting CarD/CdnL/TRCF family regulator
MTLTWINVVKIPFRKIIARMPTSAFRSIGCRSHGNQRQIQQIFQLQGFN